jgi:hypothetical protein
MLLGRPVDNVGELGRSSAARFVPAVAVCSAAGAGDAVSVVPLAFAAPFSDFAGGSAFFSFTGDGGGGGIFVPSVNEANLKSSAGNSNRLPATPFAAFVAGGDVRPGIASIGGDRKVRSVLNKDRETARLAISSSKGALLPKNGMASKRTQNDDGLRVLVDSRAASGTLASAS